MLGTKFFGIQIIIERDLKVRLGSSLGEVLSEEWSESNTFNWIYNLIKLYINIMI